MCQVDGTTINIVLDLKQLFFALFLSWKINDDFHKEGTGMGRTF